MSQTYHFGVIPLVDHGQTVSGVGVCSACGSWVRAGYEHTCRRQLSASPGLAAQGEVSLAQVAAELRRLADVLEQSLAASREA